MFLKRTFGALALVALLFVGTPAFAKTKYSLSSPASSDPKKAPTRCLSKGIKNMYDVAVRQMKKDVAVAGNGNEDAVKRYQDNLALVWEAMNEPYCGYGTRGVSAVQKSLNKTISRTRAEFLKVAAQNKIALKKLAAMDSATSTSTVATSTAR